MASTNPKWFLPFFSKSSDGGYNSLRMSRHTFSEAEFDALSFASVSEALRSLEMSLFDDLVFFAESPPESGVPGPLPARSLNCLLLLNTISCMLGPMKFHGYNLLQDV